MSVKFSHFIEEYYLHTALNLGHAARDLRYFYYHPNADKLYKENTPKHIGLSFLLRTKEFANNLFFSLLPPQLHHSRDDLICMRDCSAKAWFLYGYAPWIYPDPRDLRDKKI